MECTNPIPDLNEVPLVIDSPHPLLRPSRKKLLERRKLNAMLIVVCYLRPMLRKAILGCYSRAISKFCHKCRVQPRTWSIPKFVGKN